MEINAEVVTAAPPEAVWSILGERFSQVAEWAQPIVASSCASHAEPAVGVVRSCRIERFGPVAGGTIQERLVAFDPAGRTLEYEAIAGLPAFFGRASNRWSVGPRAAGGSVVRSRASLELRGPMRLVSFLLAWKLRSDTQRVLEDLRYYAEEGRPSPRKQAAMASSPRHGAHRPSLAGE